MLSTPYYRTIAQIAHVGCTDEPDFNYSPYNLFCMNTRLYPILYHYLGRDIEILYKGIKENNRMNIKIILLDSNDQEIKLSDRELNTFQEAVDNIIAIDPNYCLIDTEELYLVSGKKYPKTWFNNILPYVNPDNYYSDNYFNPDNNYFDNGTNYSDGNNYDISKENYNIFIQHEGIYLTFNPKSNYKDTYNNIVKTILNTIDKYYNEGVIYGADNIYKDWGLITLSDDINDNSKLYKATWSDKRFAPLITDFLINKMEGDRYIRIRVSDNLTKRHYIASALRNESINMIYEGPYIKVLVDNLREAQYVASLITYNENIATGKTLTIPIKNISHVKSYIEAANSLFNIKNFEPNPIGYNISDPANPYMFSCLIPMDTSVKLATIKLKQMIFQTIQQKENK